MSRNGVARLAARKIAACNTTLKSARTRYGRLWREHHDHEQTAVAKSVHWIHILFGNFWQKEAKKWTAQYKKSILEINRAKVDKLNFQQENKGIAGYVFCEMTQD